MQPNDPNYKPKTTIIPANPDIHLPGTEDSPATMTVVAWVIEDGRIARAIVFDHSVPIECVAQQAPERGADE